MRIHPETNTHLERELLNSDTQYDNLFLGKHSIKFLFRHHIYIFNLNNQLLIVCSHRMDAVRILEYGLEV